MYSVDDLEYLKNECSLQLDLWSIPKEIYEGSVAEFICGFGVYGFKFRRKTTAVGRLPVMGEVGALMELYSLCEFLLARWKGKNFDVWNSFSDVAECGVPAYSLMEVATLLDIARLDHQIFGLPESPFDQSGDKAASSEKYKDVVRYAVNLMNGKDKRDIVGIVWNKFQKIDGYPKTKRQYRNILACILGDSADVESGPPISSGDLIDAIRNAWPAEE